MSDSNGRFPRLLVATEFPPNASGGGPAVVRQMIREWPAQQLFWWSCLPEHDTRFGQKVALHRVATIPEKLYPHRRMCREKSWLMEVGWSRWAARHFHKTVLSLKPEAIWVIPHVWAIPPLTRALPQSNTSFHTTIQDYIDNRAGIECFGEERCEKMAGMADWLYANATTRDATSHPMISDLRDRTGCDAAQMLHAGLEQEDFIYLATKQDTKADTIRIAYAGSISVEESFALFVSALAAIRDKLPKPVVIEIFSAHSYRTHRWFDPSWMRECGDLPEGEFSAALRECMWGFAPMSLSENEPRHRFSFPTKFISYLAAALPILTLGHTDSSLVRMARAYQVGACVTSTDREALSKKLLEVLLIEDPWKVFGSEILRCARVEFDAASKRQTLHQCFSSCARKTRNLSHL